MTSPSRRHLAGVALVSATLLMTELALTRIFSVVMYYHFAFLAISIALFGVSASGVFAYVMRRAARSLRAPTLCSPSQSLRLRRLHDRRAVLAGPAARRPELLAAQPGADADDLRARRAAVLHRRPRRHARDLAAVGAGQRRLRRRSDRRRRRLPDPDSAARSPRRARRRARRGGAVRSRPRCCSRPPRSRTRDRRRRRRRSCWCRSPASGPAVAGFDVVDTKGHQGDRVLFSKWNSFSRIGVYERDARRLVAEPGLHRPAAGHALHGHRLGRVDADPAARRRICRTRSICATS